MEMRYLFGIIKLNQKGGDAPEKGKDVIAKQ
jgi:hypothetical protein